MKIKVIYPHDARYVDRSELNSLLQSGKIMAFEREHRLVVVGLHPTRKSDVKTYHSDRRRSNGE